MLRKFWPKEKKEHRRFYLLPGMGGRAFHRKQRRFRNIALVVGLLASGLFALFMYYLHTRPLH
jgi:hypothetical protein